VAVEQRERALAVLLVEPDRTVAVVEEVQRAWLLLAVLVVQEARIPFGLVEYLVLVFLLVLPALVGVAEVVALLLEHPMVALVAMVAAMVAVVEPEVTPQELELPVLVAMALTVFLFSPTHRQVGHRRGSPTLIHNIQLQ